MGITSYRFAEVKQTKSGTVHCPQCNKKRTLTLSKSYYRNGFHNEQETWEKNKAALEKDMLALQEKGEICQACQDENNNEPLTEAVAASNSEGLLEFRVLDRKTRQEIGRIVKEKWGGQRWRCVGLKWGHYERRYSAKYEAARAFRDEFEKSQKESSPC